MSSSWLTGPHHPQAVSDSAPPAAATRPIRSRASPASSSRASARAAPSGSPTLPGAGAVPGQPSTNGATERPSSELSSGSSGSPSDSTSVEYSQPVRSSSAGSYQPGSLAEAVLSSPVPHGLNSSSPARSGASS